jgi:hypothetical protein
LWLGNYCILQVSPLVLLEYARFSERDVLVELGSIRSYLYQQQDGNNVHLLDRNGGALIYHVSLDRHSNLRQLQEMGTLQDLKA